MRNEKAINYYQIGENILNSFTSKKTLLMHTCCAPCVTFPLSHLVKFFDVTLYYNNSNIYPSEEYHRRLNELINYVNTFNREFNQNVKLIIPEYDNLSYTNKLSIRKNDKEGHGRCKLCYFLRMGEGYNYANTHHFDYFTTVMTISRQKDATTLNRIGRILENKYSHTKYLYHNFKKNKGIDKGLELSKKYHLYQQHYCGCLYSYNDYLKKELKKNEK